MSGPIVMPEVQVTPGPELPEQPQAEPSQAPAEPTLMFTNGSEVFDVPASSMQRAAEAGWRQLDEEEVSRHKAKELYQEENSWLEKQAVGASAGLVRGALALPALASNILPGVEGQSGSSWMESAASYLKGISKEEAREQLALMTGEAPEATFLGEVGGSIITGGALAGGARNLAARSGGKLAEAMSGTAGTVGTNLVENAATGMALANEMAYNSGNQLTPEMMVMAGVLNGFGPLALSLGARGARGALRYGATKIDDARMGRFQTELAEHEAKLSGLADEAVAAGTKKEANAAWKAFDAAQAPEPPRPIAEMFMGGRQGMSAFSRGMSELSDMSGKAGDVLKRDLSRNFAKNFRKAAKEFLDLNPVRGYSGAATGGGKVLGNLAFNSIVEPLTNSLAGKLVSGAGIQAAGSFLNASAGMLRLVSRQAAKMANAGPSAVSPFGQAMRFATAARTKGILDSMYDSAVAEADAFASKDQVAMAGEIGSAFGQFQEVSNGTVVPAVTQQYMRMGQYMQSEKPRSGWVMPGVPGMGRVEPTRQAKESYVRKMLAVQNPLILLSELHNGTVSRETVDAVSRVYPGLFMDIVSEVTMEMGRNPTPLGRRQRAAMETLLSASGVKVGSRSPGYLASVQQANQSRLQVQNRPAPPPQGAAPKLAENMMTGSQKATQSIYN